MKRRLVNFLLEGLGALVLVVLLGWLNVEGHTVKLGFPLALGLLPLVWLGLRYSGAAALVFGALAGLLLSMFNWGWGSLVDGLLWELVPLMAVGVAGFFAKYTHKTLNNRRYASTYLNIGTASLLVSILYFVLKFVLSSQLMTPLAPYTLDLSKLLLGIVLTSVLMASILIGTARMNYKLIIPRRSPYLSRKETSRLLND